VTRSETETTAAGRNLGGQLRAGDAILLYGDLGAGKTAFVRGLAEGLGIEADAVSSPTFTLIQEYRGGRLPLYHVDLYRLDDPREIDDLGLEEIAAEGVLAVEWAGKLTAGGRRQSSFYDDAIAVRIEQGESESRSLTIQVPTNRAI